MKDNINLTNKESRQEVTMSLAQIYGNDLFEMNLISKIDECDDILLSDKATEEKKLLARERKEVYKEVRQTYYDLREGRQTQLVQ